MLATIHQRDQIRSHYRAPDRVTLDFITHHEFGPDAVLSNVERGDVPHVIAATTGCQFRLRGPANDHHLPVKMTFQSHSRVIPPLVVG